MVRRFGLLSMALAAVMLLIVGCSEDQAPLRSDQNASQTGNTATGSSAQAGAIGDFVFNDVNRNGLQDEGEPGLADVIVSLYMCDETFVATDTSDADGHYQFDGLEAGDYYLAFTLPEGYVFTPPDQGDDDALDSDVDVDTWQTPCVTLATDETNTSVDAGLFEEGEPMPAFLGNQVWHDMNMNGLQDDGEPGLAGVKVRLYDCGGEVLDSMISNELGQFIFDFLDPGVYKLEFVAPDGHAFSAMNQGDDEMKDSDVDPETGMTDCVVLGSGDQNFNVDAGLYEEQVPEEPNAVIGDFVWQDVNMNGIQDADESGLADVQVNLFDCADELVASMMTDADGMYQFSDVAAGDYYVRFDAPESYLFSPKDQGDDDSLDSDADAVTGQTDCFTVQVDDTLLDYDAGLYQEPEAPKALVGDFVWNDTNMNGIQDAGEAGLEGVGVSLYTCEDMPVASTTTDAMGMYEFADLDPGMYKLAIEAPTGMVFSPKDQGTDDSLDSDFDPATGMTDCFTVAEGDTLLIYDAGLYTPMPDFASLGDIVWNDVNADGIQDMDEMGLEGVKVRLFTCADEAVDSAMTDAMGEYHFDSLMAGDYYVVFEAPEGYVLSPQDQGMDDAVDSDADPMSGATACITLEAGEENLTVDAGLYVESLGCTYSKGFWKNHAGLGPGHQPDRVTALLPITLGESGGARSLLVEDAHMAVDLLGQHEFGHPSNGITKLYAQLLAAKLNIANGADNSDIAEVIDDADAFLAQYDWNDWDGLSRDDRKQVLHWKDMLDDYNNGIIGPGHCDHGDDDDHDYDNGDDDDEHDDGDDEDEDEDEDDDDEEDEEEDDEDDEDDE